MVRSVDLSGQQEELHLVTEGHLGGVRMMHVDSSQSQSVNLSKNLNLSLKDYCHILNTWPDAVSFSKVPKIVLDGEK